MMALQLSLIICRLELMGTAAWTHGTGDRGPGRPAAALQLNLNLNFGLKLKQLANNKILH